MSWIRDESGTLVNLDKIEKMEVIEVEKPGEEDDHMLPDFCLIAYFGGPDQYSVWLASGSEEHCIKALDAIASKLHMIKV